MANKRQELYDRIRQSSKQQVELEEMERLGFWHPENGAHKLPAELIERSAELSKSLNRLVREDKRLEKREFALAKIRKQKLKESRERQAENKAKREAERLERAEAWKKRKSEEILFLGAEVSGSLNQIEIDHARLQGQNLPQFLNHQQLAEAMSLSVGELRFLAYERKVSKVSHYKRFQIPKKAGGTRLISAPMPRLKSAQHWILQNIIEKVPMHDAAHGFRAERSILTNAKPHEASDCVINCDLKDFFPNITLPRVYGLFHALGYSKSVSTIFALLCTEPPVVDAELDGETWHIATSVRHLPQGAPTSPGITNLLCRRLDARLTGIAKKHGFTYTRYADDLTFSGSGKNTRIDSRKILWHVRKVVEEEGFIVHPDKVRSMGAGRRQEVTGLTVNEKVGVSRHDVRNFRSLLHRLDTQGVEACTWRGASDRILAKIDGYASYLKMVDAERYASLCARAEELLARNQYTHVIRHPKKKPTAPAPLPHVGIFRRLLNKILGK
ncbi:reverse transcriptase domain-containing protein [Coraliomargarita sp. SDUM461003]|uniref:RNA-directed DNA polymerase n=1 Tax=Thalassobacterium maritimum TaxID=3041265 RepID=A0ABU1AUV6_9BACT|nr:reverse transcriptase domain-containing protein [Coraliomargarita sp. SDUM461003]MDQ8207876.1 reverse transcriptase domain-containing protein [Coraliomargarita sp. SDUM461003]